MNESINKSLNQSRNKNSIIYFILELIFFCIYSRNL